MSWEKTVKQIVHESHQAGVLDLLHALLNHFEQEDHTCQTREWAERLYRDPNELDRFVRDSQALREGSR